MSLFVHSSSALEVARRSVIVGSYRLESKPVHHVENADPSQGHLKGPLTALFVINRIEHSHE